MRHTSRESTNWPRAAIRSSLTACTTTVLLLGLAAFLFGCPPVAAPDGGNDDMAALVQQLIDQALAGRPAAGAQGADGSQGPAGADGAQGPAGADGAQGPQGLAGSNGTNGAQGPQGAQGPAGPQGPTGPQGPGGRSVYGDGSAGARTVAASETLADANTQYTDFTIDAGVTLTVPSGTIIRCSGVFTNNGTIVVQTAARGSAQNSIDGLIDGAYAPAEAGVSLRAAAPGELGDNTAVRFGGIGGVGLDQGSARWLLYPGAKAGGGSGGSFVSNTGARGGGSFTVLAAGAVVNAGTISADGASGLMRVGGAGGGVVILASQTSATNTGAVTADGGDGGDSDDFAGVGAGGGGGIIHFLSPSVSAGATSVAGGSPGVAGAAGSVTEAIRQGGGGGGACGGSGGMGGMVTAGGDPQPGTGGGNGYVLTTAADPTALF